MKVVAIIPIKSKSKRIKGKNFKKIYKKKLYEYLLDKLKKTKFDDIYITQIAKKFKDIAIKTIINLFEDYLH